MKSFRRIAVAVGLIAAVTAGTLLATSATSSAATPFANGKDPIIFVHGILSTSSIWDTMEASLKQNDGYTDSQLYAIDYTWQQSNVTTAQFIAQTVDQVLAKTGASQVDIVSHSMGSISSRYCIKFSGCAGKVNHWISLDGVNNGTSMWSACSWIVACQEMAPNSSVLTKLNTAPQLPTGVKWSTFWSANNFPVVPATSTELPGATNTETAGNVSHISIPSDSAVISGVAQTLGS
ncbi:MAG TPA: lipase [Pseudonocardiaceae bacterium]|jgi:triacylglycerol lipase|nr:lipase [Pseudonocardiaceae bacterium]